MQKQLEVQKYECTLKNGEIFAGFFSTDICDFYLIDLWFFAVTTRLDSKMEPPVEENVVKKDKPITARILSSAVCILKIFFAKWILIRIFFSGFEGYDEWIFKRFTDQSSYNTYQSYDI